MILSSLSDTKTLCALVHASPNMYRAYLHARNEIFTAVTVSELAALSIDVLNPVEMCEVVVKAEDGQYISNSVFLSHGGQTQKSLLLSKEDS